MRRIIVMTLAVFGAFAGAMVTRSEGYQRGYADAIADKDRENGYVLGEMTDMGFCTWVRTQFKPHCEAEGRP